MKLTILDARWEYDRLWLQCQEHEAFKFLDEFKDKAGVWELKKPSNKRSLNANSYCWVLCGKIAEAVKTTDVDVYRDAVLDVGVYREYHLKPAEVPLFEKDWQSLGLGWQTRQVDFDPDGDTIVVFAYKGSSTYNTEQMSRLINWLVGEADELGIETENDAYINSLLERWEQEQHGQKRL